MEKLEEKKKKGEKIVEKLVDVELEEQKMEKNDRLEGGRRTISDTILDFSA